MWRPRIVTGLLAAAWLAGLACAPSAPATGAPSQPAASGGQAAAAQAPGASLREEMIAKARQEGEVVVSGSNADEIAKELRGFRDRYPFVAVKAITASPNDVVNRVMAESQAGRPTLDVVESDEAAGEVLARSGRLSRLELPHLADFVPGTQPSHGLYVVLGMNPSYQVVYNTELVKPADVPKSWEEMAGPKWQGKTVMSRSGDDLPAHLAFLWRTGDELAWDRAFDFVQRLAGQRPKISRSYRPGAEQVALGESAILWTAPGGSPAGFAAEGAPISASLFPKAYTGYRAVSVVKDGPHPAAAWLLLDYLSSPEGQFEYTDRITAIQPANQKAKPGKQAQWGIERGAKIENLAITPPDELARLLNDEALKKSEEYYFRVLGIR